MLLQICCNTLQKSIVAQVIAKHSDYGASFEIADVVEYLGDFLSIPNRYFNGM
jgi:hypothetical protein